MNSQARRDLLRTSFIGMASLGLALIALACGANAASEAKPNFIIIYTDDHDFSQVGCYGGEVLTPNMDRLAEEGIRFTQFHVTSPVCSPSRYSTLTGRLAGRCPALQERYQTTQPAMIQWNTFISENEKTIAHLLKEAGYKTGIVGKWHLGQNHPQKQLENADHTDPSVIQRMSSQYQSMCQYVRDRGGFDYAESIYGDNVQWINVPLTLQYHNQEWITEKALDFIEQNKDQPFFLHMATTLPHDPSPVESMEADPRISAAGILEEAPSAVQPSREDVFRRVEEAGVDREHAPITWLDDAVGAVLSKLDDLGLTENTLVILASDNGVARGKMTCYESAANLPCIIRWKGHIEAGQVSDELIANIDFVPTMLDLAGAEIPADYEVDGISLAPLLLEGQGIGRESLFIEVVYVRAVLKDDWKYVAVRFPDSLERRITPENRNSYSLAGRRGPDMYGADLAFPGYHDRDQLYNIEDDPEEQVNLASDPEHQEKLAELKALMKEYLQDLPHAFGEFTE